MFKQRFRRRTIALIVPVVVAVGAGSAIAASTPSSSAVVHACATKGGHLHLANRHARCAKGETALAWNQKGPAGLPGAAGAQGPAGPAGAAGPAGDPANVVSGVLSGSGQAEGFAKVDGIAGGSADPAHTGEIDVASFTFGGKHAPAGGGGGSKPTFSDVEFTKLYDVASPKLFQALASGAHIASVTFTLRRPGANGATVVTYTLSDVVVTAYEQGATKAEPLLERVALNFAKVQISATPAGGAPITAGWDVKTNQPA